MKLSECIMEVVRKILNSRKLLFYMCIITLVIPNFFLFFTEQIPLIGRMCNIVLPVSVFWYIMTLGKKPGKIYLWLLLFIFFNAFQLVLLYLFGNSVIAVDMFLNLVTTNPVEVNELLSNITPAIIYVVIIYVPLLVWSIYSLKQPILDIAFRLKQRKYAQYGCCLGMLLLLFSYVFDKNFVLKNDIYPINVMYNVILAIDREIRVTAYHDTSRDFAFNARCTHPDSEKELYVLVIGETARAANFGLYGYDRNTTPLLESVPELIVFKDAFSQSNTTHKSVPMIMSAVSAENYDDIYAQKGIVTAFGEVGYATAFFSNQRRNHSFIDFFGEEADVCKFVKDELPQGANISDEALLNLTKNFLAKSTKDKKFIVLHTYGSHFNYTERYPSRMAYYKPDKASMASAEHREALVNAYDNSIRATDDFLFRLIKMIEAQGVPSAVLFVSDHGEDIYDDDRELFLHASPIPSLFQLHVPLLVWTSAEYNRAYPQKQKNLMRHADMEVSTNLAVFHTLLDLAGITTSYKKDYQALSHDNFKPEESRTYLNDHNKPVPISQLYKNGRKNG